MLGVFLDTETNGLDFSVHKVIDIAYFIIDLDTGKELGMFNSLIRISESDWENSLPESLEVNGFSYDELIDGQELHEISSEIEEHFTSLGIKRGEAVFICQNPSFDRNFFNGIISTKRQEELQLPYHWLDLASMYWALKVRESGAIPPKENRLSKDMIAHDLGIPPENRPHRAYNGAAHLLACYEALIGFPNASNN